MSVIRSRSKAYQVKALDNFTGGLAVHPQNDNEAEVFENLEWDRNGWPISRLGCYKENDASIGSEQVMGIGIGQTGSQISIIVAKTGSTWYYANKTALSPRTYAPFTCARPGNDPVRFEFCLNIAGTPYAFIANKNFRGVYSWQNSLATATVVTGSPVNVQYLRWFGSHLYASGNDAAPYTVYFSDTVDPFKWPTLNNFNVPSVAGKITGLEIQPGQLLIICEAGIWVMRGDPPLAFVITQIQKNIGCDKPLSISTEGSATTFIYNQTIMVISEDVKSISDKIRGYKLGNVSSGGQSESLLNANFFVCTINWNIGLTPNLLTNLGSVDVLYMDRNRWGSWGVFKYYNNTAIGFLYPVHSFVVSPDGTGIIMNSGDGNLYNQPLRSYNTINMDATSANFTMDDGVRGVPVPVVSKIRTKRLFFGNSTLQKQIRMLTVGCDGINGTVNLRMWDSMGLLSVYPALTNVVLPCQTDLAGIPSSMMSMEVDVVGSNMELRDMTIAWRPVRLDVGPALL